MSRGRVVEDRVFGLEKAIPGQALLSEASTSYDLFSCAVQGAEVAYAQQGTVNHPPLLFLHGWGASHKFWRHAFSGFAPRWRCVAPDLPGFGLSAKPERDYSVEGLARWLEGFLDRLQLPHVTLVGHSMGGTIALLFALTHPARVEKLALVNPLVRGRDGLSRRCRRLMTPGLRSILFALRRPLRGWISGDFTSESPLPPDLVDDILAPSYRAMVDSYRSLSTTDLSGRATAMPTLAIGTDLDRVLDPAQIDLLPCPKVRIGRTGHIPMVERPAEFNRVLDDFLRG